MLAQAEMESGDWQAGDKVQNDSEAFCLRGSYAAALDLSVVRVRVSLHQFGRCRIICIPFFFSCC